MVQSFFISVCGVLMIPEFMGGVAIQSPDAVRGNAFEVTMAIYEMLSIRVGPVA
jgi:hypothetical protein